MIYLWAAVMGLKKWLEMCLLKFRPDVHHFCLGFCAGLLCVGCFTSAYFLMISVFQELPRCLSSEFNSCLGLNVIFAKFSNFKINVCVR